MTSASGLAGPRFRFAGDLDVGNIVALVQSAYRGEASRAGWTTEAHLLDGQRTNVTAIADAVADPDSRLIVATDHTGAMLGCCQIERREAGLAYFGTFAVRPVEQGNGLGKAILAEAEQAVQRLWSALAMELTVISQRSDLIAWYERRGFRKTGEHRDFPYGDDRFGLPRRNDLDFTVLDKNLSGGGPATERRRPS